MRRQIAAALDLVVHVSRRRDGSRHVDAIAQVAGDARGVDVAPLWQRRGDELVVAGRPTRTARTIDADPPDPGWFAG